MTLPNVVTIILAGGRGTRLYPLTKLRSKPAVPTGGKFRLIDIPISNCLNSGLRKIYICTQFSAESLHRHIFSSYRFDNFSRDFITILSAQQTLENRDWYQGTADAVRQNLRYIQDSVDYVVILSGDHLYRMNYQTFLKNHIDLGADISISVIAVEAEKASEFGIMQVNQAGRITAFQEKPTEAAALKKLKIHPKIAQKLGIKDSNKTHLASMGIYVFNKTVLKQLLENSELEDFGKEVIPLAIKKYKVQSFFFDGYWEDIGTIRSFFEAHLDLTKPLPHFNFFDEQHPIYTHPRFLPGSKLLDSHIEATIVCDGSIIERSVIKKSIIGIRSHIERECRLEEVIMMGADIYETLEERAANRTMGRPNIGIGDHSIIRRAIIDKNARIGTHVRIENPGNVQETEQENYAIRDGIIVIPKGSVIPDGSVI